MISRFRSNWPYFELAIIASLIGVGWALFHVYGTLDDLVRQRPEAPARPDARQVGHVRMLTSLREYYLSLADRVTSGVRAMREGLDAFVQDRSVTVGRYVREADSLQHRLTEAARSFDADTTKKLGDELLTNGVVQSEGRLARDIRFGDFMASVIGAVSNHVATLNIAEGLPLSPDIVQRKISKAAETENVISSLAAEARERAARLDSLLDRKAVELVTPTATAAPVTNGANHQRVLQRTLRMLAAVFLLQAIVVIVSLYRRMVVLPLHQSIIETTTSAEFQRKLDHFARVATGLAHEIRNPLTAINIRLFTLQKSLTPGRSQHADTVLIRNEIDRLEQILKNFLRLARPSDPKFARMTARPLLDETRNLLSEQCRTQGVDLWVEKTTETPFLGDSTQLKQVLINLVQNAAESIAGDGRVTLRAYDSQGQGDENGQKCVVLEVEDTGCGISPDVQERLFDPFFSTKENGTGLGLPIAAKIVDHHKGRLEYAARADHGATFRVILPIESDHKSHA